MTADAAAGADVLTRCCGSLADPTLTDEQVEATAMLLKALADPSRIRICNALATAGGPVCACDLEAPTGLSQPTVSHHMRKLVAAGLVTAERRGTWVYYELDREACARLSAIADFTPA